MRSAAAKRRATSVEGVGPRGRYVKRPWQIQPSKVKGKNGELTTKNERFRILFRIDGY